MMLLSIGCKSGKSDVYDRLAELVSLFKEKGINIGLVESDSDDMHFIKCMVRDEDNDEQSLMEIKKSFDIYAANIIYQVIVGSFQIDLIKKILKENHSYFRNDEIDEIAQRCVNILSGAVPSSAGDYFYTMSMKDKVTEKILDYLLESTEIVIEGFLRFRLKDINNEIEEFVDKVVEEYLIEREYNEFIKLLKYFVEIQESRIDIVNIVALHDGSYCMYDNNLNDITGELLKDLINEGMSGEISYDDLLISSLITAAPRLIVIHNISGFKSKEILDTIKSVFSERVKICPGCGLCFNRAHKL